MSAVGTMVVLSLVIVAAFARLAGAQDGAAAVVVAPVVERSLAGVREFVGTVVPSRTSTVGSAVEGRVEAVYFEEGDPVVARKSPLGAGTGEGVRPLVRLLSRTHELELAAARAELRLREQELLELKNGPRPEELAQAKARREAARARWEFARSRLARMETLFRQNRTISQEELDEARSTAIAAEQAFQEAAAAYALLEAGPRQERIAQAEARLEHQREVVRRLEDILQKYTIWAPFDGVVVRKQVEVGMWLKSGDPVAEILDLDPVEVRVFVPEVHIGRVRRGGTVPVRVDAYPGRVFVGSVERIVPQADPRTRTFPVRVRLANPSGEDGTRPLKAGMLARAALAVGEPRPTLMVPKDAVVIGGPQPVVFVVEDGSPRRDGDAPTAAVPARGTGAGRQSPANGGPGTARPQTTVRSEPVQILGADGEFFAVQGRLAAGDRVVVEGNERLRPGQAVRVIETAASDKAAGS